MSTNKAGPLEMHSRSVSHPSKIDGNPFCLLSLIAQLIVCFLPQESIMVLMINKTGKRITLNVNTKRNLIKT